MENKCIGTNKKKLIIGIVVLIAIITVISISAICSEIYKRNTIIENLEKDAINQGLKDVTVKITSKSSEYDWYNVVIYASNLDSYKYKELFELDRNIGCSDAYITSYNSNGDVYRIYPSTLSIYKNGESVYSDYWNSSSHKSASSNKNGYGGYNGTRPGSSAENAEKNAAKVKCKQCGRHSTNGVNSLCDSCKAKEND